ncbi:MULTISPECIES: hypothetical protein [Mycolicibacterium]|uniref:Uncharacterized protein n=1 Tax=Mycolicibacterium gilvum (strain DSM 45189 / LMG 24558 / Spyr1) TaxID=278137 RepID=E6TGR6_MYCSR|nr:MULTISPECIES: hypothetical protein [Mycolicibacterium]ADT96750.1 hypothetical protein Mspyr1_00120 [Mycolicibacterium gilvum Spyr1]MBV5246232.1 hypothetical protein [Mycolicibacterium sp. PAM1]
MAESADVEKEARDALLKAIRAATPSASTTGLQELATAYALTVGARGGHLPGVAAS